MGLGCGGNADSDSGLSTPNHHGVSSHHGGVTAPHTSPAQPPRATPPPLKTSSTTTAATTTTSPSPSLEPHRGNAPFNLSDFSSSQTLLNLVRTASAQNASQLETYLRGAVKRPHEGEQARADPLDLSVGTAVKRPRSTDSPRSLKGDVVDVTVASPSRKTATSPWLLLDGRVSSKSPKLRCGSVCSDHTSSPSPCAASEVGPQGVAKWTVDEVVQFVASVDSCQEYAEKFREQSIDGTGLPLLTEDHLTVYMGMRLGPALKLRTSLAKMTGRCTVCMHCIHCHGEDNDRRTSGTPALTGTAATPVVHARASSSSPPVPRMAGTPPTVSVDSPASSK